MTTPTFECILAVAQELGSANVPTVRKSAKELAKALKGSASAFEICERLSWEEDWTARAIGFEILNFLPEVRRGLSAEQVVSLTKKLDSWYSVDTFGMYISGPAWRDGQIGNSLIGEWATSSDLWLRRSALVSSVHRSRRGTEEDREATLWICKSLLDDREDMVVKAMSWALRELSAKHRTAVEEFLAEFQGRVAARAVRETRHKLDTGRKYKASKQ